MPSSGKTRRREDGVEAIARRWRTGSKVGRTVYADNGREGELIGVFDTPTLAAAAVAGHNAALSRQGRPAVVDALVRALRGMLDAEEAQVRSSFSEPARRPPWDDEVWRAADREGFRRAADARAALALAATLLGPARGRGRR